MQENVNNIIAAEANLPHNQELRDNDLRHERERIEKEIKTYEERPLKHKVRAAPAAEPEHMVDIITMYFRRLSDKCKLKLLA